MRVGGLEFGHREDDYGIHDFDPTPALSTSRIDRPLSDGRWAGRDLRPGELWVFELVVNATGLDAAVAASNRLEAVWTDPAFRQPGALVELSYDPDHVGRWRTVYGRFGRFTRIKPDIWARNGGGRILAEFEVLDPRKYGTAAHSVSIPLVASSTGGLIAPLVAPLMTTKWSGESARAITVTGDAPTPLAVTFHGPLTDPQVRVGGQVVGIVGEVAGDLPVTVDGRTQVVSRGDGVAVPGRLSRRSRLDALTVAPGTHTVTFTGASSTNTGYVEIRWRDASWGL